MNRGGPHLPLSSRDNHFVKFLRSLAEPKHRKKEQVFIIEGIKMVEEALRDAGDLVCVVAAPSLIRQHGKGLLRLAESKGIEVVWVTEQILDIVSESKTPQPVLAVVRMKRVSETALMKSVAGIFVVAHGLQDPGNLGTIIRTAEAAAAAGVGITRGTVDPYGQKAVRASMGSILRIPVVKIDDFSGFIEECVRNGFQTVGLAPSGRISVFDIDFTLPSVLIVGSEAAGLPEDVVRKLKISARIPMAEGIESLNAAAAASVVLYEAYRQRMHAWRVEGP